MQRALVVLGIVFLQGCGESGTGGTGGSPQAVNLAVAPVRRSESSSLKVLTPTDLKEAMALENRLFTFQVNHETKLKTIHEKILAKHEERREANAVPGFDHEAFDKAMAALQEEQKALLAEAQAFFEQIARDAPEASLALEKPLVDAGYKFMCVNCEAACKQKAQPQPLAGSEEAAVRQGGRPATTKCVGGGKARAKAPGDEAVAQALADGHVRNIFGEDEEELVCAALPRHMLAAVRDAKDCTPELMDRVIKDQSSNAYVAKTALDALESTDPLRLAYEEHLKHQATTEMLTFRDTVLAAEKPKTFAELYDAMASARRGPAQGEDTGALVAPEALVDMGAAKGRVVRSRTQSWVVPGQGLGQD